MGQQQIAIQDLRIDHHPIAFAWGSVFIDGEDLSAADWRVELGDASWAPTETTSGCIVAQTVDGDFLHGQVGTGDLVSGGGSLLLRGRGALQRRPGTEL